VHVTTGSPVVETKLLTKKYGDRTAVDGITFTVNRGEVVALLGPNGAGKSTTMKMLTCFMPATSGEAKVAGFDIYEESLEVRKRLGYMPENMPLYTEMRVREYLDYRARLKGIDPRTRGKRIEEVAERCWIDDVIDRIVGQLSKGYRQRVGLAESLIHDPEILVLDEPTIGLDPAQIRETRNLIKEVGQDRTVILSTHILPEAEMICNRVMIINRGRLIPEEDIERMRASGTVTLEAAGDEAKIRAAVEGVSGVKKVRRSGDGTGERAHRFEVHGASSPQAREALAKKLVEIGSPPREMKSAGADLEEIFVRITAGDS
jgi:ABC-2 type transport system ATP-binding protein